MRIGILGGTFNPPHLGHLKMAKVAKEEFDLDSVWFLTAGIPPHKEVYGNAVSYDRFAMVNLMIEDEEGLECLDIELHKAFKNYTYLTMEHLCEKYPEHKFYYIIGEDSLRDFSKWKHPERIAKCCDILVAIRDSSDFSELESMCKNASSVYGNAFSPIKMSRFDISSTELRDRLIHRKKLDSFSEIHPDVLSYINERDLYMESKVYTMMTIDEIKKDLSNCLKESRFVHTEGVMYTAASLAMRYNASLEKAVLAGLLHDCAKNLSDDELIKVCKDNGIEITEAEMKAPYLLHAKVGAHFAKTKYGVTDEDILHAIKVHTTGEPNMSLLDMIIFTADYIEPNRRMLPNLPEIRSKAFIDIKEAVVFILRDTIEYLESTGKEMDDMTLKTYEFYKETTDYFKWN